MDMETTVITSLDYDLSASCRLLSGGHESGEDGAFLAPGREASATESWPSASEKGIQGIPKEGQKSWPTVP